jgi:hypothetical protein
VELNKLYLRHFPQESKPSLQVFFLLHFLFSFFPPVVLTVGEVIHNYLQFTQRLLLCDSFDLNDINVRSAGVSHCPFFYVIQKFSSFREVWYLAQVTYVIGEGHKNLSKPSNSEPYVRQIDQSFWIVGTWKDLFILFYFKLESSLVSLMQAVGGGSLEMIGFSISSGNDKTWKSLNCPNLSCSWNWMEEPFLHSTTEWCYYGWHSLSPHIEKKRAIILCDFLLGYFSCACHSWALGHTVFIFILFSVS